MMKPSRFGTNRTNRGTMWVMPRDAEQMALYKDRMQRKHDKADKEGLGGIVVPYKSHFGRFGHTIEYNTQELEQIATLYKSLLEQLQQAMNQSWDRSCRTAEGNNSNDDDEPWSPSSRNQVPRDLNAIRERLSKIHWKFSTRLFQASLLTDQDLHRGEWCLLLSYLTGLDFPTLLELVQSFVFYQPKEGRILELMVRPFDKDEQRVILNGDGSGLLALTEYFQDAPTLQRHEQGEKRPTKRLRMTSHSAASAGKQQQQQSPLPLPISLMMLFVHLVDRELYALDPHSPTTNLEARLRDIRSKDQGQFAYEEALRLYQLERNMLNSENTTVTVPEALQKIFSHNNSAIDELCRASGLPYPVVHSRIIEIIFLREELEGSTEAAWELVQQKSSIYSVRQYKVCNSGNENNLSAEGSGNKRNRKTPQLISESLQETLLDSMYPLLISLDVKLSLPHLLDDCIITVSDMENSGKFSTDQINQAISKIFFSFLQNNQLFDLNFTFMHKNPLHKFASQSSFHSVKFFCILCQDLCQQVEKHKGDLEGDELAFLQSSCQYTLCWLLKLKFNESEAYQYYRSLTSNSLERYNSIQTHLSKTFKQSPSLEQLPSSVTLVENPERRMIVDYQTLLHKAKLVEEPRTPESAPVPKTLRVAPLQMATPRPPPRPLDRSEEEENEVVFLDADEKEQEQGVEDEVFVDAAVDGGTDVEIKDVGSDDEQFVDANEQEINEQNTDDEVLAEATVDRGDAESSDAVLDDMQVAEENEEEPEDEAIADAPFDHGEAESSDAVVHFEKEEEEGEEGADNDGVAEAEVASDRADVESSDAVAYDEQAGEKEEEEEDRQGADDDGFAEAEVAIDRADVESSDAVAYNEQAEEEEEDENVANGDVAIRAGEADVIEIDDEEEEEEEIQEDEEEPLVEKILQGDSDAEQPGPEQKSDDEEAGAGENSMQQEDDHQVEVEEDSSVEVGFQGRQQDDAASSEGADMDDQAKPRLELETRENAYGEEVGEESPTARFEAVADDDGESSASSSPPPPPPPQQQQQQQQEDGAMLSAVKKAPLDTEDQSIGDDTNRQVGPVGTVDQQSDEGDTESEVPSPGRSEKSSEKEIIEILDSPERGAASHNVTEQVTHTGQHSPVEDKSGSASFQRLKTADDGFVRPEEEPQKYHAATQPDFASDDAKREAEEEDEDVSMEEAHASIEAAEDKDVEMEEAEAPFAVAAQQNDSSSKTKDHAVMAVDDGYLAEDDQIAPSRVEGPSNDSGSQDEAGSKTGEKPESGKTEAAAKQPSSLVREGDDYNYYATAEESQESQGDHSEEEEEAKTQQHKALEVSADKDPEPSSPPREQKIDPEPAVDGYLATGEESQGHTEEEEETKEKASGEMDESQSLEDGAADGYDATAEEESQGPAEEDSQEHTEEEDVPVSVMDRVEQPSDKKEKSERHVGFAPNLDMPDPGYMPEDSQDHTEDERPAPRVQDGYQGGESSICQTEDEGIPSEGEDNIQKGAEEPSSGEVAEVEDHPTPPPDSQSSGMSAADEQTTGRHDEESSEIEDYKDNQSQGIPLPLAAKVGYSLSNFAEQSMKQHPTNSGADTATMQRQNQQHEESAQMEESSGKPLEDVAARPQENDDASAEPAEGQLDQKQEEEPVLPENEPEQKRGEASEGGEEIHESPQKTSPSRATPSRFCSPKALQSDSITFEEPKEDEDDDDVGLRKKPFDNSDDDEQEGKPEAMDVEAEAEPDSKASSQPEEASEKEGKPEVTDVEAEPESKASAHAEEKALQSDSITFEEPKEEEEEDDDAGLLSKPFDNSDVDEQEGKQEAMDVKAEPDLKASSLPEEASEKKGKPEVMDVEAEPDSKASSHPEESSEKEEKPEAMDVEAETDLKAPRRPNKASDEDEEREGESMDLVDLGAEKEPSVCAPPEQERLNEVDVEAEENQDGELLQDGQESGSGKAWQDGKQNEVDSSIHDKVSAEPEQDVESENVHAAVASTTKGEDDTQNAETHSGSSEKVSTEPERDVESEDAQSEVASTKEEESPRTDQDAFNRGRWSQDELTLFQKAMESQGNVFKDTDWEEVAKFVGTRSVDQCRGQGQRYYHDKEERRISTGAPSKHTSGDHAESSEDESSVASSSTARGRWSQEELEIFHDALDRFGENDFESIAKKVGSRNATQCKNRFKYEQTQKKKKPKKPLAEELGVIPEDEEGENKMPSRTSKRGKAQSKSDDESSAAPRRRTRSAGDLSSDDESQGSRKRGDSTGGESDVEVAGRRKSSRKKSKAEAEDPSGGEEESVASSRASTRRSSRKSSTSTPASTPSRATRSRTSSRRTTRSMAK